MAKLPRLSRGERLGTLILLILMTLLVGTLAFRKWLFSQSTSGYRAVMVEYSDSASGVSRRDSVRDNGHEGHRSKRSKMDKEKKGRNRQSRKGQSRDILDEQPL